MYTNSKPYDLVNTYSSVAAYSSVWATTGASPHECSAVMPYRPSGKVCRHMLLSNHVTLPSPCSKNLALSVNPSKHLVSRFNWKIFKVVHNLLILAIYFFDEDRQTGHVWVFELTHQPGRLIGKLTWVIGNQVLDVKSDNPNTFAGLVGKVRKKTISRRRKEGRVEKKKRAQRARQTRGSNPGPAVC